MVGAHVQCLYSDAAHLKSCGKFPGAPRDNKPCDCKWWDATITQDNKSLGFSVIYVKNDAKEGWEEHDVDISRLRRTELGPEPATEAAVERNLTTMLGIAATNTKWQHQWSSDWLEANAAGAHWPDNMGEGQWEQATVCPKWQGFLSSGFHEALDMLGLRPEWAKDDGHCQFRAIGGTVFGDSSLGAAIEIRKNLVAWVEDKYNGAVQRQLPDESTKEQLLARLQKYEYDANGTSVGMDYHGNADTLMVCAMALGVGFLVLKVTNEHDNTHALVQAKNPNGKMFGLVYNFAGPHWSATVPKDGKGDKEAVYFFHQHSFASSHEAPFQCVNETIPRTGGVHFTTVSHCFAYLKAMHANGTANANHPYFTGVAASILQAESTSAVVRIAAEMGRHTDFDAASWGAARQEKMLVALRAKFDGYPDLAGELRDTAGLRLAQASQCDCDHGIGLAVVDAELGMAWRGQNFFGNCLELFREELLTATTNGVSQVRRSPRGDGRKGRKQKTQKPKRPRDGTEAGSMKKSQQKEAQGGGGCGEVAMAGGATDSGAPAGTKCNVCQRHAVPSRELVMCGHCSKWVHAEYNVCDKPAHQGREMCSKGSVMIECALCFPKPVAKVTPGPANEEPAGGSFLEHWLGHDSTGLQDEQLFGGEVVYYNGDRADILDTKLGKLAGTLEQEATELGGAAAAVGAASIVRAGRASTVSRDAIAAADIVRVQHLTQVEPAGQAGVQSARDANAKTMRGSCGSWGTGLAWELSVEPEFGAGQALQVLPAVLPEGEPYVFLSVMQQAKCQEVGQPRVQIIPPERQIIPPERQIISPISPE